MWYQLIAKGVIEEIPFKVHRDRLGMQSTRR